MRLRYPGSSTTAPLLGCVSPTLTCETRFVTAPLGPATPISRAVLDRLRSAVGPAGIIEDATDIAPYCKSWRDDWQGAVPAVLRPKSTKEVAAIVRISRTLTLPSSRRAATRALRAAASRTPT